MKLAIPIGHEGIWQHIVNACVALNVEHETFDLFASDWIAQVLRIDPDGCIYVPEFRYASWREVFRERINFISAQLGIPVYPRLHELELYESKRRMAYWLMANEIPHPRTWIFNRKNEAFDFLRNASYPLYFKTDFGNAAFGVRRLLNFKQARSVWRRSFGRGYKVPSYYEGALEIIKRAKAVARPAYYLLRGKRLVPRDTELDSMLLQADARVMREWRLIKSGESFFGHEKVCGARGLHSGSGATAWSIPPEEVFDFVKDVCRKGAFGTMAVDIFETVDGRLLVNELQTVFGVIAKNQMYRQEGEKLIGFRKVYDDITQMWKEEDGEFGQDYCYRLRIEDFLKSLTTELLPARSR